MSNPLKFIWACALFLLPFQAGAQSAEWVTVGKDVFAFHEEIFEGLRLKIEPPVASDVEVLVELIGLPNISKINSLQLQIRRSYGLNNAFALYNQNFRSIVFDPDWAAGATAEFYLVLGHEAGHLFCGHVNGLGPTDPRIRELEADRFGGASIRRIEVYRNEHLFDAVFAVAAAKYPEQGSRLYPPRAMRLDALRQGYEQGSPCGDLAPVVQGGYVPNNLQDGNGLGTIPATPCRPVRVGPTSYVCAHQ